MCTASRAAGARTGPAHALGLWLGGYDSALWLAPTLSAVVDQARLQGQSIIINKLMRIQGLIAGYVAAS
jgi:hypothetical protein